MLGIIRKLLALPIFWYAYEHSGPIMARSHYKKPGFMLILDYFLGFLALMVSIMVGNGVWVAFYERSGQCASFGMLTDILRQLWRVHTIKNHVFTLFLDYFYGFLALMATIMVGNGH